MVNLSYVATVVHQNHETPEEARRECRKWHRDAEWMATVRQAGGFSIMITLHEPGLCVTCNGMEWQPLPYRLSKLAQNRTRLDAVACKRRFQAWLC